MYVYCGTYSVILMYVHLGSCKNIMILADTMIPYIAQKFDGENFDEFDKCQRFVKVFPSNLFSVYAFPMWHTINLSKFSSSNFHAHTICQSFLLSNFCAIRYLS